VPVTAALRPCGQSSCNVYLSGAPFGINVIKGTRRRPQLIPCGQHPPQPRGKLCSLVLELTKTARRARRLSDTVRPAVTGHPAGRSRGMYILTFRSMRSERTRVRLMLLRGRVT
jgi:hypothetical protein